MWLLDVLGAAPSSACGGAARALVEFDHAQLARPGVGGSGAERAALEERMHAAGLVSSTRRSFSR